VIFIEGSLSFEILIDWICLFTVILSIKQLRRWNLIKNERKLSETKKEILIKLMLLVEMFKKKRKNQITRRN